MPENGTLIASDDLLKECISDAYWIHLNPGPGNARAALDLYENLKRLQESEAAEWVTCPDCGSRWAMHPENPAAPCVGRCPACGSYEATYRQDIENAGSADV